VCIFRHRRHKGNRHSRNGATAATAATLVAGSRKRSEKKEAGTAGGESGARAHGPALGGEAGSVLIGKLIRKVPSYATTSTGFPATGGVSATGTRCSVSPIELKHMGQGLRRAMANLLTRW
jgi:hypothetical protein